MEEDQKNASFKRKTNMKIYTIHKTLTQDLLFYYAIKFLFLTTVKSFTAKDIIIASAFWGIIRVIMQIPISVIIDKVGSKKSLILGDLFQLASVTIIMLSQNMAMLLIANFFGAISYDLRDVAESDLLNKSIPDVPERTQIYSKLNGRGIGNYYYFSAVSAILSGFLFEINPYIPMCICATVLIIAIRVASMFYDVDEQKVKKTTDSKNIMKKYKDYFKDLKLAFSFIFTSRRLKALMLFSGLMYGMIMVMNTYEMNLLKEIEMSASITGFVYAGLQLIAGFASKHQEKFHEKYKNKTLTIIGISYAIACLVAGTISVTTIPYIIMATLIVATYIVRYCSTGLYYVLIKKYVTNFTNEEVANKVYSAQSLVDGIGNALICAFGAGIVSGLNIKYAVIIFGITFLVIMSLVLYYMKNRVGLKPEEYRKKDINYKEYVRLK